jgi:hypothetical protein
MERYFITKPIPGGYAYFDIRDQESVLGENFSVATFWKDMPNVEKEVEDLCAVLNVAGKLD